MSDGNLSPVGWYVGSYLLRFIELDKSGNYDDENKFLSWENTVLVQASDPEDAYDKLEQIASEHTEPYKGGAEGVAVQWVFEGVTEILPIYEELEHGTEIMFSESTRKLKNLKKIVKTKGDFAL
ncbi:DUF4288 domain-containing protein [Paraferrimonas sedimenticola]|uniref:DUF4288 domain-containing protein n=1 Tax=Paraferrimonas sedimenticola TaxID=375674 RepID=A0AA37RWP8_9GAMM|nr:DUF4288 domain-containing protein [Paraferrimonas sedimenticola]GLP96533.1 hypothetical protein GCM10007895_18390 [Paraferrimonas sedimenticola]